MKKNLLNILLFTSLSLFVLLLILVLVVDVTTIPFNGKIGLTSLNKIFYYVLDFDTRLMIDSISDIFMYASILGVVVIAGLGAYQLFKNKSIKKVDSKIILLGCFIVIAGIIWVLFDNIIVINYRPFNYEGKLEGSFPSTHVMLVTFVYLASLKFFNFDNKPKYFKYILYGSSIFVIIFTGACRILSLMHWFTDVLGGVLIGLTLYFGYLKSIEIVNNKTNK